ncbi:TRAP transporter substrate-binding protein [Corticicoccus populi]|uniref:TRAP transporter substrate-binding protein n=1 Tax=Corticicoccus populi TaxID=1812821 RepID=A0ABW5WYR0_9STAP
MKKNYWFLMLFGIVVMILSACGNGGSGDEEAEAGDESSEADPGASVVLDLSIPEPEGAKFDIAAKAMDEKLLELSDGEMSIKVHYNNSLGGEREVIELMSNNSVDMAIQSSGPMINWGQEFALFDLPFLFENLDHAHAVMDSEIGDELAQTFEEATNVKVLGWVENGFVATSSNSLIDTVEDVEGMDMRVQENEIQIDTWEAFGASPTPMAWPEVYTSLQQGVLDGHSNSLATIQTSRIFEVQSHVALIEDRYQPGPIAISKMKFDSLTEEQQGYLEEAAEYAVGIGRQANQDKVDEAYDFLIEEGVEINDDVDKESFMETTDPVYEKWGPRIGEDLIERVRNFEY